MRLQFAVGIVIILILGFFVTFSIIKDKNLFLTKQESGGQTANWTEIVNQAAKNESEGNYLKAKSLYEKLVNNFANFSQVGDWQKKIWDLNIKILFSPTITEGSILYEIKSGDSLAKIANKFNTTAELIKKSNGLLSDKIIAGKKLKVWTKSFNIVVDKSQNILILKSDDDIIKTYIVSTGINNSTPKGNFKLVTKLVNPVWYKYGKAIPPDSPDNILGSRWMGFDLADYGIHGTTEPETLGQQITQGCVRMSNSNVEELFSIVPTGTEVTIVD